MGVAPRYDGRSDAPPELIRICQRMMAKKAANRYQSMDEPVSHLQQQVLPPGQSDEGQRAAGDHLDFRGHGIRAGTLHGSGLQGATRR